MDRVVHFEKIKAAGGEVAHGPNEIPGIGNHAYCTDTEGNMFGVIQLVSA
ncbi:MAG: hypothetical protein O3B65_03560 [Chloroflexi bacterium]|nr:hypothetical protein [Chloroflexota bacterium]